MSVEVVLVQHADKERQAGDPGLTALGFEQARHLAACLAGSDWDTLLCSPMLRARQTAQAIAASTELTPQIDARLRERMNWGDAGEHQTIEAFLADWHHATLDRDWQPPSGASSTATGERMLSLLDELREHGRGRSLLVTHGGATCDLLRTLIGDDELESLAPGVLPTGIPSCGLTTLVYESNWIVRSVGASTL